MTGRARPVGGVAQLGYPTGPCAATATTTATVENAEVAEIKRAVFRALTRLRAATIKEFDIIARLETHAIDDYNDLTMDIATCGEEERCA